MHGVGTFASVQYDLINCCSCTTTHARTHIFFLEGRKRPAEVLSEGSRHTDSRGKHNVAPNRPRLPPLGVQQEREGRGQCRDHTPHTRSVCF